MRAWSITYLTLDVDSNYESSAYYDQSCTKTQNLLWRSAHGEESANDHVGAVRIEEQVEERSATAAIRVASLAGM